MLVAVAPPPVAAEVEAEREVVVISDLHFGLGRGNGDEGWHNKEDFRWPVALAGFLEYLSRGAPQGVDLVIAGDFLELWQMPACKATDSEEAYPSCPPETVRRACPQYCTGPTADAEIAPDQELSAEQQKLTRADFGCSLEEILGLEDRVLREHDDELRAMAEFAATNRNCLYIVPGNHDAALVLPAVRDRLLEQLTHEDGARSCVEVVGAKDERWVSESGVVVEHGHMIGTDVNAYTRWPDGLTRRYRRPGEDREIEYLEKPWGEGFVQSTFNNEECGYPLIDNLSPKSAGIWYRIQDRGFTSAKDVARFVHANVIDTSARQFGQLLGPRDAKQAPDWTNEEVRTAPARLGYRLFAYAVPTDHPLYRSEEEWQSPELVELRAALDAEAESASREDVLALCDLLEIHSDTFSCREQVAGALFSRLFSSRARVVRRHVDSVYREARNQVFVYGHTHKFEMPEEIEVSEGKVVKVANTGAFQRLVHRKTLKARAKQDQSTPRELLARDDWESFVDPCYTFVRVRKVGKELEPEVRAWFMDEKSKVGVEGDPCSEQEVPGDPDSRWSCAPVGTGCPD